MGRTRKVGTAGRFGSRYGRGIRKRLIKVESKQKALKTCPQCRFKKVKRQAAGLYKCGKCGAEFTGGAYQAETLAGKTIKKMVTQKSFAVEALEVLQHESSYADIEREVEKALDETEVPMAEAKEEAKEKNEAKAKVPAKKEEKEGKPKKEAKEKAKTKEKDPSKKAAGDKKEKKEEKPSGIVDIAEEIKAEEKKE